MLLDFKRSGSYLYLSLVFYCTNNCACYLFNHHFYALLNPKIDQENTTCSRLSMLGSINQIIFVGVAMLECLNRIYITICGVEHETCVIGVVFQICCVLVVLLDPLRQS